MIKINVITPEKWENISLPTQCNFTKWESEPANELDFDIFAQVGMESEPYVSINIETDDPQTIVKVARAYPECPVNVSL